MGEAKPLTDEDLGLGLVDVVLKQPLDGAGP